MSQRPILDRALRPEPAAPEAPEGPRPVVVEVAPPSQPELTARSLLAGCAIGALLAVANVYMGLKTGFWESGTVTASVLAFGVVRALTRRRAAPYSLLEHNLTQTTAATVAGMPAAAGLLAAVPALALLGIRPPAWVLAGWGIALGGLGILAALALRRRLLLDEALPFPTGVATAEVITALHAQGKGRPGSSRAVLGSGAVAMAVTWFREGAPSWIPQASFVPGRLAGTPADKLTLGVGWSPMLFAIGLMVGPLTGLSVLLGALVAWCAVAPALARAGLAGAGDNEGFVAWLSWPSVGLMLGAAAVSLVGQARSFMDAVGDLRALGGRGAAGDARVAPLALAAGALVLALGVLAFRLPALEVAFALVLLFPLCSVCARVAGQTDVSPVSQTGQLGQVAVGALGFPGATSNIVAGSVVSGAAAQTGISLWALKAGHLLGASVGRQALAQAVGVLVGAAVGIPAYALLMRAYGLQSQVLTAPFAKQARVLAVMATHGLAGLPPGAALATLAGFTTGALLTLAARGRWMRFVPSAAAMGIGFILPAHSAVTLCLGALLGALARAVRPELAERYVPAVGAGAIAGESLVVLLTSALHSLGVLR